DTLNEKLKVVGVGRGWVVRGPGEPGGGVKSSRLGKLSGASPRNLPAVEGGSLADGSIFCRPSRILSSPGPSYSLALETAGVAVGRSDRGTPSVKMTRATLASGCSTGSRDGSISSVEVTVRSSSASTDGRTGRRR